jgi:hypothetical protein
MKLLQMARNNRLDRKENCHCGLVSLVLLLAAAVAVAAVPKPAACEDTHPLPQHSLEQPSEMERAYMRFNQGVVYQATGNSVDALQCFKESYRLLPKHPLIQSKVSLLIR